MGVEVLPSGRVNRLEDFPAEKIPHLRIIFYEYHSKWLGQFPLMGSLECLHERIELL